MTVLREKTSRLINDKFQLSIKNALDKISIFALNEDSHSFEFLCNPRRGVQSSKFVSNESFV